MRIGLGIGMVCRSSLCLVFLAQMLKCASKIDTEEVLVFQKPDGSGEFANGSFGVPVGQGIHVEKDPDDRPACDFIVANDAAFMH